MHHISLSFSLFFHREARSIPHTVGFTMTSDDFTHVPPPWKLKGDIYLFSFWTPRKQAEHPPTITYSPLEANSSYINPEGSRPLGGISMVQIIRYTESPVGPYDELILSPGFHEYTVEENGKRVKKKNARITRIYVSQKHTCWNGRKSELRFHLSSQLRSHVSSY